jgi:hypothetical protein
MPGLGQEGWMTLEEAAQRYEVSLARLRKAAQRGTLRAEKPQGKRTMPYFVTPEAVRHYLATVRRGRPPKKPAGGA